MTTKLLTPEFVADHLETFKTISSSLDGDYWERENYLLKLDLKWELSYYVSCNDAIVAFIMASRKCDHLHINRIVVSPEYTTKGIGKMLILLCISNAKRNNLKGITLKVSEKNSNAISFYIKLGFKKTREEKEKGLLLYKLSVT